MICLIPEAPLQEDQEKTKTASAVLNGKGLGSESHFPLQQSHNSTGTALNDPTTLVNFDSGQTREICKKKEKRNYFKGEVVTFTCSKFDTLPVSCWFTNLFGTLLKKF